MRYSANTNVLYALVRKVSRVYLRDFGEIQNLQDTNKTVQFTAKSKNRVESMISDELDMKYKKSGYKIILNNDPESLKLDNETPHNNAFIVNGLDGILNFEKAIPFFCITIAHRQNGELVNSIIYNPITDDIYIAEKGNGATHNNIRIRVSNEDNIKNCLISTEELNNIYMKYGDIPTSRLISSVKSVRSYGSISLISCMVASAQFNAGIIYAEDTLAMEAAKLLVIESKGIVRSAEDTKTSKSNYFIVSNEKIYDNLMKILL